MTTKENVVSVSEEAVGREQIETLAKQRYEAHRKEIEAIFPWDDLPDRDPNRQAKWCDEAQADLEETAPYLRESILKEVEEGLLRPETMRAAAAVRYRAKPGPITGEDEARIYIEAALASLRKEEADRGTNGARRPGRGTKGKPRCTCSDMDGFAACPVHI